LRVFLGLGVALAGALVALGASSTAAAEPVGVPAARAALGGSAACSTAVRRRRTAALKRYRRKMPAERRAYFRRHKSAKERRAFVRRQQTKLRRLQRALGACSKKRPKRVAQRRVDLAIAFSEPPAISPSRRRITYRLTASNPGRTKAAEVSVFFDRGAGTQVVKASGGKCGGDKVVSCEIGSLAAGESKPVEVVLRPLALGTVDVKAEVLVYDAVDSVESNSRISSTIEVSAPAPSCPATLWPGLNSGLLTEGDSGEDSIGHPSIGVARALMVFVDFADAPASESTQSLYDLFVPEAARLFSEVSYGRFGLDVGAVHRWVRLKENSSYYSPTVLLRHAVAAVDPELDFRQFSIVYIVGPQTVAFGTYALLGSPGNGASADGVEIRHGAVFGRALGRHSPYDAHVLLHETGHALGLPDLYKMNVVWPDVHSFVGSWDPMGSLSPAGHLLAWHKWRLGWLDPPQLGCLAGPGVVEETLSALSVPGGAKAIVALTGPSTAIVAEARRQIGKDADLCEEGVLVYSVDATMVSGDGPVRVRPAQPDGDQRGTCGVLYEAPFDVGPDEVAQFHDGAARVTVEVLSSSPEGYRVRVTKH
jgi:M6 family metalloprotease-like protein